MTDEITLDAPETRLERFLAAAAGVEGITLDEPETRIEKYLYKIAQGSGGVPAVEEADKGKFLHANESTGAIEWASGGSGGGGGVVHTTISDGMITLDKTWQDVFDGEYTSICIQLSDTAKAIANIIQVTHESAYSVDVQNGDSVISFETDSASGYPSTAMG